MKLKLIIAIAIIAFVGTSCNKNNHLYSEKSGIITYKPLKLGEATSTQTIYFDDYGAKELRVTVSEGDTKDGHYRGERIYLRNGNDSYQYDKSNTLNGIERANKVAYKTALTPDNLNEMNLMNMSKEMKKRMDYKNEGAEKVAGLEGTKYSLMPENMMHERIGGVHYHNLPLKISVLDMVIEAEKVQFNVTFPADKFQIPAGVEIIDMNEFKKNHGGMGGHMHGHGDMHEADSVNK